MLDALWQAWKGFSLDTAELSFPVQQIPYRRYSTISVMFFNRMKLECAMSPSWVSYCQVTWYGMWAAFRPNYKAGSMSDMTGFHLIRKL